MRGFGHEKRSCPLAPVDFPPANEPGQEEVSFSQHQQGILVEVHVALLSGLEAASLDHGHPGPTEKRWGQLMEWKLFER